METIEIPSWEWIEFCFEWDLFVSFHFNSKTTNCPLWTQPNRKYTHWSWDGPNYRLNCHHPPEVLLLTKKKSGQKTTWESFHSAQNGRSRRLWFWWKKSWCHSTRSVIYYHSGVSFNNTTRKKSEDMTWNILFIFKDPKLTLNKNHSYSLVLVQSFESSLSSRIKTLSPLIFGLYFIYYLFIGLKQN